MVYGTAFVSSAHHCIVSKASSLASSACTQGMFLSIFVRLMDEQNSEARSANGLTRACICSVHPERVESPLVRAGLEFWGACYPARIRVQSQSQCLTGTCSVRIMPCTSRNIDLHAHAPPLH